MTKINIQKSVTISENSPAGSDPAGLDRIGSDRIGSARSALPQM